MELTREQSEKLDAAVRRAGEIVWWDDAEKPVSVSVVRASISRGMCREEPGDWVSIRPCKEEKTYLGIMLGPLPTGEQLIGYHPDGELTVAMMTNPCIYVPDLGRCVWGYESWWGVIRSPEDLRTISDADISNIWYVQALKSLSKG